MQIFRDLLPWLNLVSFLPAVLATPSPKPKPASADPASTIKSVPDCAASPTEFSQLPFQFWIETLFLKPYKNYTNDDHVFRPSNPVGLFQDYDPTASSLIVQYSQAFVAETEQNTQFFTLVNNELMSSDLGEAKIWPFPSNELPGYSALVWDATTSDFNRLPIPLDFTAVKACTSTNETELLLRAKRRGGTMGT